MRFADLHAHNHTKGFLWMRHQRERYERKGEYHPWTIVSDSRAALNGRKMASKYAQADLVKLWNGKVRLTFNALYPVEKGFFSIDMQGITGADRWYKALTRAFTSQVLPLRDYLQFFVMWIPDSAIDHFQSASYSYWDYLNEEYAFATLKDGVETRNSILTPTTVRNIFESERKRRRDYPNELDATGTYVIPRTKAQLVNALATDKVAMVLTIEGGHALGTDRGTVTDWLANVDRVKQWDHPILFITFAHHFANKLCGHAHSFPGKATYIMGQEVQMNEGFTPEGWRVLRRILAIKESGDPDPAAGYRILIDVKHMSAKARHEYYESVVRPGLERSTPDVIPVIASHVAYTGVKTLQQLIAQSGDEKDGATAPGSRYNRWNINICDEDVLLVHRTNGLIGLSFDQRIVGVRADAENDITILWANIKAILEVVYAEPDTEIPLAEKHRIWECLSIGTDFEGWIDPVDPYPTALFFETFRTDLIAVIDAERKSANAATCLAPLKSTTDVTAAVDRFCCGNAEKFVKKHFPVP